LVIVSTHAAGVPHSICPAAEHLQLLAVQVAPAGQALLQLPQWDTSLVRSAQLPPAHCICPEGQLFAQLVPAQTCVPVQAFVQLPQWLLSDWTHMLLQLNNPDWH
jgi:hypothetical protein